MSPKKFLFFLDIDGTLLDSSYQSTEPQLGGLITSLQEKDNIFSINSNRALEDLLPVAQMFDITGPLIGENGCFIYDAADKRTDILLSDRYVAEWQKDKEEIRSKIVDFFKDNYPDNPVVWMDVDTVKEITRASVSSFVDGTFLLLNNKYRKYTQSIHVRQVVGGESKKCPEALQELESCLKENFNDGSIVIATSSVFNNLLIYPLEVSKKTAVKHLSEQYEGYKLVFIGDEIGDYHMSEGFGDFYTVANAEQSTKDHALFVSDNPSTKGVYDILQKVILCNC